MVCLVEKTLYALLPELLCITLHIPLADAQFLAYLRRAAQIAHHKVGQCKPIIAHVVYLMTKHRGTVMKIKNKVIFLTKPDTAVYQLGGLWKYRQLHLYGAFFDLKITTK